jgi:hypothetical protein
MSNVPSELAWGDVYLSPLLPVFSAALLATWLSTGLLNKLGLSRYILFPNMTFLAIMTGYLLILHALWIPI